MVFFFLFFCCRNDAIVVCPACIDENVEEQDVGQLSLREVKTFLLKLNNLNNS